MAIVLGAMTPLMVAGQAPEWWWVTPVPGSGSYVQTGPARAHNGGYFVSLKSQQLEMPWGPVQGAGGVLLHINPEGEPTAAVPMPAPKQLDMMDDGTIRFLLTYENECSVGGNVFTSPPGVSALVGFMDTEGTLSDLVNIPALMNISQYDLVDIHKGPSGDLYAMGTFIDSVSISDTLLIESGTFLAHFAETGALIRALRISVNYQGPDEGKVLEGPNGSAYVVLQHVYDFIELGQDPPVQFGVGLFSFGAEWQIQWSILNDDEGLNPDGRAQLSTSPSGGVYLAYADGGGEAVGGPVHVIHYNEEGDTLWHNASFSPSGSTGGMNLDRVESTSSGGVLISGGYEGVPIGYGPYPIPNRISPGMFAGVVNSEGQWVWMTSNTVGVILGCVASMSPNGDVYASGAYINQTEFGPFNFPYSPGPPCFIGRIGFGPVQIEEQMGMSNSALSVYPNPSSSFFSIRQELAPGTVIELCDISGRVLKKSVVGTGTLLISTQGFASGTYVVRCNSQSSRLIVE